MKKRLNNLRVKLIRWLVGTDCVVINAKLTSTQNYLIWSRAKNTGFILDNSSSSGVTISHITDDDPPLFGRWSYEGPTGFAPNYIRDNLNDKELE